MEKMEALRKKFGHPLPNGSGEPGGDAGGLPGAGDAAKAQRDAESGKGARRGSTPGGSGAERKDRAPAEIERTKPNKWENFFMTDLMILRNSLTVKAPHCRERLEKVNRHGWRDLRLLLSLVSRIQEDLIRTMPESRDEYYRTIARSGHYQMEINGPIHMEHNVLIGDKHLGYLLDRTMSAECLMCMRDGNEIGKCPLRDVLLEVAPPSEIKEAKRIIKCEYADVARQIVRDEEIEI